MEKLSSKVLSQIKEDNIKPTPKWQFLLKDSVTYFLFVLSIVLGSIGSAITFFLIGNIDFLETSITNLSFVQGVIMSVPLLWLLLTILFIFIAYYNFKHIPDGYKWTAAKSLLISLFVSILLGLVLNSTGVAQKLNDVFANNIPNYTRIADPRYAYWMRPEAGLIAGEIVSTEEDAIKVVDLNRNFWIVNIENTYVSNTVSLKPGQRIRITGEITGEFTINAIQIRPWNGRVQGMHNFMQ